MISIYNTLIVDAIQTDDNDELLQTCRNAELIQRVMYESYVPSYAVSYDCLGDQEAFSLKYSWELAIYFGFFVFPMFNNLFTNKEFMPAFLRRFRTLGPINGNIQRLLSAFFQWKKRLPPRSFHHPNLVEFYDMAPLRDAEQIFYQAGLQPEQAIEALDRLIDRLEEFARYIIAHVYASVLSDRQVLSNAPFLSSLDLSKTVFDPDQMAADYSKYAGAQEIFTWNLDPFVLERFIPDERTVELAV